MKNLALDISNIYEFISRDEINRMVDQKKALLQDILKPEKGDSDVLGWVDIDRIANHELLKKIKEKAGEIRSKAKVFVLIGIGGSNQGARAVIDALGDEKVEIIYAGNTLSPHSLNKVLSQLRGKSVYVNVIAKKFATLEPGITFRVIRHYMEETYGVEEAGKRIIATGSMNGSNLEALAKQRGYTLMPFPLDVGGRFSVLSAVGLLPVAVAGIEIDELLDGARAMKKYLHAQPLGENIAVLYGVVRNLLLRKGYCVEMLSFFEPLLHYFSKWWVQLFGESEGKEGKGIFPTACSYSEDLHSLGQYVQEGRRMIFETFLNLSEPVDFCKIPHEATNVDGFSYIDGQDFSFLNKAAYEGTVKAHLAGGVPCLLFDMPQLSPSYMGQLFFFFEYSCYISASLLGVNPFDQPGVEAYKSNMFSALGKR